VETLLDVTRHKLGHFKHRHLSFAAEDRFQVFVCIDQGLFLLILKAVLLDVVPDFLRQLTAGEWLGSDDLGQYGVRLNGFHEGGVRFFLGGAHKGEICVLWRDCHDFYASGNSENYRIAVE